MEKYLLLGCGKSRVRQIVPNGKTHEFEEGSLITVDINPDRNPSIVWDLNKLPMPFENERFEEIHLYHTLEHLGSQGDYKQFFGMFDEFYRLLKPGGLVCASFPREDSVWAFGDPSHVRVVSPLWFQFLSQKYYIGECDERKTVSSDFRYMYKSDFEVVWGNQDEHANYIIVKAVKNAH